MVTRPGAALFMGSPGQSTGTRGKATQFRITASMKPCCLDLKLTAMPGSAEQSRW
jgi:hypothetical protein